MAKSRQELLEHAWLHGSVGSLSAWSEAKLWAARAVWRAENTSDHGLQTFAAGLVKKYGTGEHPSQPADANLDVGGLSRAFKKRAQELVKRNGGRLAN